MDETTGAVGVEQLPENAAAAFPDEQSPFDKTLYNISGILTNKYPDIDFQTIPGFNPGSGGSTSTNFLFFMFSLIFGMVWITYITFFNSRIVGKILTRICSRFVTDGYVRIGSLSWSVLPGKVMFRDVAYITKDYTIRVQDGFVIFRWWRSYVPKDVSEDLSHSDTRVSVQLNGLELHVYNRTAAYQDLERKFGFETSRFFPSKNRNASKDDRSGGGGDCVSEEGDSSASSTRSYILGKNWRDLIPVIKIDLSSVKLAFGNRTLPTTLVLSAEDAHCTYSTKPAGCPLDHFMHFIKGRAENFKVLLAPSPKYTGLRDEAPRYMGEGFVVVSSNTVHFYHYMDEPGVVADDDAATGNNRSQRQPAPEWGLDLRCGKSTDFSYGPWADRQRELIYKFFFPQDYQPMVPTEQARPGQKRQYKLFRVRLSTEHPSTVDILFSKQKETSAVHVNIGQGTNFELKIPWVIGEEGYMSTLTGTFMMVEATTSMAYRELVSAETLEFKVDMNYPPMWNCHQEWLFSFIGTKTTLNFIYAHKWFFQDLIDDWSTKGPPDLLYFVPYTWKMKLQLKHFELVTPTNEFNWIDTSSTNQENAHMGLCGEALNLSFDLPYVDFLPNIVPFNFDITGEEVDLVLFLPETNTSHDILYSLDMNAKIVTPEGQWKWKRDGNDRKWRSFCKYEEGWIDCCHAPKVNLHIAFAYHPMPTPGPSPQAHVTTEEKEKRLLNPLRAPSTTKQQLGAQTLKGDAQTNFDPNSLEADKVTVKLDVDRATLYLYGTVIRSFMHLKENIFGEDQQFTPMDVQYGSTTKIAIHDNESCVAEPAAWDERVYRPIEVILDISLCNLQAHLLKNCSANDDPCPFAVVEDLSFEMDKKFRETRLQLILSPVILRSGGLAAAKSEGKEATTDSNRQGHLLLSGLQFRGHAMFSELDRQLGEDTLEYAWLIEIQCGSLIGKISADQLYNLLVGLETFVYLTVDKENVLKHPRPYKTCQHNSNQKECFNTKGDNLCATVEDVKYRLVRFLMDSVDVHVVEKNSSLRLQACPLRLSACNLHGLHTSQGISALVKQVQVQQYISSNFPLHRADIEPSHHRDIWIETGSVRFGPVFVEGGISGPSGLRGGQRIQHEFLQKHDNKTKRLWFLWPQPLTKISSDRLGKCGCVGGCNFFGQNSNGCGFFEPEKGDVANRKNVALPCLRSRTRDPGYGQSILHDDHLVAQGCGVFGLVLDNLLPPLWPHCCDEPTKLPFSVNYGTHKSSSSHNSIETPKHPKYHRSFSSAKQFTPVIPSRKRSISSTTDTSRVPVHKGSQNRLNAKTEPKGKLPKATSMTEVQSNGKSADDEESLRTLGRTESLVSDVLSFYSLDDDDPTSRLSHSSSNHSKSANSRGLRASASPTSTQYETASQGGASSSLSSGRYMSPTGQASSPTSMQYETATSGSLSDNYETASQGSTFRNSSSAMSFETSTLQPDSSSDARTLRDEDFEDEDDDRDETVTLSRPPSSASFISAVSEHEDLDLVDLHMQVNKPITDSPLLMSSYISHLTQLRCAYWKESVPVLSHEPHLHGKIKPEFNMLEEGFSVIKMKDKEDKDSKSGLDADFNTHSEWDTFSEFSTARDRRDFVSSTLSDSNTSRATIIVKFNGSIDMVICPIMLQSLESLCNSLLGTFKSLHPVDVVNHLHSRSVDRVESRNTLKKEKSLDLQEKLIVEPKDVKAKSKKDKDSIPSDMFKTFEKSTSSFVQASITLPKINVMILQASVVEEMCAFSALDRVRDITCVSLLALGIQNTTFQFSKTSQSKKTVQIYIQGQRNFFNKKKKSKYKITPDSRQNEPFAFESSETQREEILMSGSVDKVHSQLRRLRNDSSILKDALITAIPNHRSKVFFYYVNVPQLGYERSSTPVDDVSARKQDSDSKMGYNMCECGFEGINIKFAKRSCNQEEEADGQGDDDAATVLTDKLHVEDELGQSASFNDDYEGEENHENVDQVSQADSQESKDIIKDTAAGYQGKRSTTSGCVELKTTWFNFAAPPKTPISKKIDFTKLDWNLLSTASPSIDAWLGPIDRIQEAFTSTMNQYHQRVGATMASLMADALDCAPENFLKLTKYDKLTALSKTLRDDPSCQLCSILLKYVIRGDIADIEANLDLKGVPPLTMLRQGIVVLSRQWKNALYTPILIEYNLRCRNLKSIYSTQMNLEPVTEEEADLSEGEVLEEEEEEAECEDEDDSSQYDEGALLLKGTNSAPRLHIKNGSIVSDISASIRAKLSPAHFSPISDEVLLLEKSTHRVRDKRASVGSDDESDGRLQSASDLLASGDVSPTPKEKEESLYDWMRRQQYGRHEPTLEDVTITIQDPDHKEESIQAESTVTPQTKSMHLLDAHIIFEPLLSSLGLMPQQIQNLSLKNLGSNVSILGSVDQFRIDIIESEFGKRGKTRASAKEPSGDHQSAAFLCQKIFLQTDMKKVTDIQVSDKAKDFMPLYMTRAQLKRHTSSYVNFSVDVEFISQKVNMPLLRLLNQIATMHQNVKETHEELRELRPEYKKKEYMRHKKSSSGSSTSSNVSAQIRQHHDSMISSDSSRQQELSLGKRQTPSPSTLLRSQLRNRPRSFAQKFRPNSRLAGYSNLESPIQEQHDSFILTSAPLERIMEEQTMIRCWKTMYNLLELYSTMPTTKTVQRQSLTPVSSAGTNAEVGILLKGQKRPTTPTPVKSDTTAIKIEQDVSTAKTPDVTDLPKVQTPGEVPKKSKEVSFAKADIIKPEHTPIIVFGLVRINKIKLMATLSGLKLDGEIKSLQTSMQYREKIRAPMKGVVEASVLGNIEQTKLVLLEGPQPNQQTVVKVAINKSNMIHTSQMWKTKDKNSGTFSVELIHVEIPQHPVDLHSIVTRGTKELSSTLQEFRGVRILQRGKTVALDDLDSTTSQSPKIQKREALSEPSLDKEKEEKSNLIKPFVMQFHILIHKLLTSAALLPSLQAEYSMEKVSSRGVTGSKAKFVVDLPKHTLSFSTKLQDVDQSDANLPSEASIGLPKVQVSAEYIQDEGQGAATASDGSILSQGSYLKAEAEIGQLEHFLTTDLLNHLVFVQKVFMREVNDVVQKMSGSDRPVPVWTEFGEVEMRSSDRKKLLFSVAVRLRNITITATTPANTGVRFETGNSELHISNRVQNIKGSSKEKTKIFTKARVNIKLSLGQLIRHPIYFEAEPQFQQQAYFKTDIHLRNAFQGESVVGSTSEAESDAIFITLDRPLIFVMPVAVDRAILFWLSYKNAWEYWTEQRLNLNKDVLAATAQVLEKVPISHITSQLSAQHVGTLFLQLNVRDIGLCVPYSLDPFKVAAKQDTDVMSAIVATVASSSISACSARSTVSKGKFKELCVRFTDDFDHFLDDWKPDHADPNLINLCTVSEGSYEICNQTTKATRDENAKWLLHIQWQMTGVDVHVDTNIGKHLSALANTMTSVTGGEEEEEALDANSMSMSDDDLELSSSDDFNAWKKPKAQQIDLDLPAFLFDPNLEKNVVAKYLEHEINEQAKTVEDLQKLGASDNTVAAEIKKLNELQNIASKNFRQDLAEKLRRQKTKASYLKEKFGLGPGGGTPSGPGHSSRLVAAKSKSVCLPSPSSEEALSNKESRKSTNVASFKLATDDEAQVILADLPRSHRNFLARENTIGEEEDEESPSNSPILSARPSNVNNRLSNLASSSSGMTSKTVEPNVDFEFHVKIFINSGKCVLHTLKEEDKRKMKKEKSFTSNAFDSPNVSRKSYRANDFRAVHSTSKLRDLAYRSGTGVGNDTTIFFIPGLDTRVHYISKTDDSLASPESSIKDISNSSLKRSSKKATLTAWMTLQSIQEETIISPTILEFLEEALAPIPTFSVKNEAPLSDDDEDSSSNDPDSNSDSQTGLPAPLAYASFPVDVIVYFHMQSSTFRFSCLPVSRVECMLRLPSLNLVFSSKRADGEIYKEFRKSDDVDGKRDRLGRLEDGEVIGGLSITGCLNDFSLYMFHPYGGGRKQRPEEMNFSPLTSEERRDSLSVNVAFVKFHISRSRKLNFNKIPLESSHRLSKLMHTDKKSMACVRFSTIVDIGSASFKYDIRRLTEILAFPKAWYRRTLVRRLFLGELKTTSFHAEKQAAPGTPIAGAADGAKLGAEGRRKSLAQQQVGGGLSSSTKRQDQRKMWIGQTTAHSWETLVMTTIKFKELTVHMNMGNVMGNVEWVSKDFRAGARLSISSTGHKNMLLSLGLNGSNFEAKSGIVGGAFNLGKIETVCQLREDSGIEPYHKLGVQLDVIEVRVDYMSTSVLMARISHFNTSINDDWHVTDVEDARSMKPAQIFVQGDLCWDQLQVLISKSTTADLLKIGNKLEEFFSQQFKSSKKLFSSLEPRSAGPPIYAFDRRREQQQQPSNADGSRVSHHRHWQKSLQKISGMKIYTLPFKLPDVGSVLGGVLELRGKHFSLACFHGINFKSKSWALFSLKDPSISFVSDAQDVIEEVVQQVDDGEGSDETKKLEKHTTVIQTLSLSLGQTDQPTSRTFHGYMATVKKISRSVSYLPPIKSLPEWFNYAFRCSELDDVFRFPSLSGATPGEQRDRGDSKVQQRTEEIFALPCLRMDLKTEHKQGERPPHKEEPKPRVDCTFVTDFDNHIYVTTDAEAFFFLHDLITSYMKEKERVRTMQQQQSEKKLGAKDKRPDSASFSTSAAANTPTSSSTSTSTNPLVSSVTDPLNKDWRRFECNTWHLEPTVRLISWAGSEIEPYGVDYILQRLGFSHARITIPKWLQRGCMDPLDKAISVLVMRAIQLVQEEKGQQQQQQSVQEEASDNKQKRQL